MPKSVHIVIGLALVAGGIVLLVMGLNATESIGEELQQEVTGKYSEETRWYIIGGVVAIVAGIALSALSFRKSKLPG